MGTNEHTFSMNLEKNAAESTIKMDGVDITRNTVGIDVSCRVGELTTVSLEMFSGGLIELCGNLRLNTSLPELIHAEALQMMGQAMSDVDYAGDDETADAPTSDNDLGAVAIRFMELLIEQSGTKKVERTHNALATEVDGVLI